MSQFTRSAKESRSASLISEEAFKRIQADDPKVKLKPYRGRALTSANKPLVIVGTVQLKACTFSQDVILKNKTAVVVRDLAGNQCLLGRDWQRKIPGLSRALGDLTTIVRNMSKNIREKFGKKYKSTSPITSKPKEKVLASISRRPESIPKERGNLRSQRLNKNEPLKSPLSLIDAFSQANSEKSLRVELVDLAREPITSESSPLPLHVKEKVREAIQERVEAEIIGQCETELASALRVVHKAGFSMRITVDYEPLDKSITDQSSMLSRTVPISRDPTQVIEFQSEPIHLTTTKRMAAKKPRRKWTKSAISKDESESDEKENDSSEKLNESFESQTEKLVRRRGRSSRKRKRTAVERSREAL